MAGDAFSHHSFETKLFNLCEESFAIADDVFREFYKARGPQNSFQRYFPLHDRARHQIVSVHVKQIENEVNDLCLAQQRFDVALLPAANAWLQKLEARHAVPIKRHDLAVENRFLRINLAAHTDKLGILMRHIELIARDKTRAAILHKAYGAKAVPLRFKNPFIIRERFVNRRRQHRVDNPSHARGTRGRADEMRDFGLDVPSGFLSRDRTGPLPYPGLHSYR